VVCGFFFFNLIFMMLHAMGVLFKLQIT
jgi:hypothetical protein